MKFVLVMAVSVLCIVLLFVPALKKYRGIILLGFGGCALLLSAAQTIRTASLILPFYHATNQVFYQPEFIDEYAYPDALLPLIVKNKTVYIKDDLDDYIEANKESIEASDSYFPDIKYWTYQFYHQVNLEEFLKAAGANVIASDDYNNSFIDEKLENDFELVGYTNDMNRYLFPLSELKTEWSNSFFYYWYYSTYLIDIGEMKMFINPEGINGSDEIVILWDDKENEYWYVMSKDYYDREVAGK